MKVAAGFVAAVSLVILASAAPVQDRRHVDSLAVVKRQTYSPTNGFYAVSAGEEGDEVVAKKQRRQTYSPTNGFYAVSAGEEGEEVAAEKLKRQTYSPTNGFYAVSAGEEGEKATSE